MESEEWWATLIPYAVDLRREAESMEGTLDAANFAHRIDNDTLLEHLEKIELHVRELKVLAEGFKRPGLTDRKEG